MEYIDGTPLKAPIPVEQALQYAVQICDALDAAHRKGITHRDLKPGNILVTKSGVKLLDFGLAKMGAQAAAAGDNTATISEPVTKENAIIGTLQYMSPEQLEGKPADARSDIFAFGLVFFEVLAGKPAFAASSQASLVAALLKDDPPALSGRQPAVSPALERVVRKCLRKDPDARWQSAADLRDEFQWIAQSSGVSQPVTAAPRAAGRSRILVPAAIALAAGLAIGAFWQSARTPKPVPWIATRLAGPLTAQCPAISPDGQLVAFLSSVDSLTQVAVMKSDGSSWTQLTNQKGLGYAEFVTWSPDGAKIYFSRYFDRPRGVYSIPALGGEPTTLLDDAIGGLPLPDGSLLVAKVVSSGSLQIHRFYPESGRSEALPAFMKNFDQPSMAVLPGGKELVFFGFVGPVDRPGAAGIWVLNLETKKARVVGSSLPPEPGIAKPLAVMPDGKSIITVIAAEDLKQIVKIPADGSAGSEALFSLPGNEQITTLAAAPDGAVYLDAWDRPGMILRFKESGGEVQQTLVPFSTSQDFAEIWGAKPVFPLTVAGKHRLVAPTSAGDWRPFLQTAEESSAPFTVSAEGNMAFLIGKPPTHEIAIASARDGRILQRVSLDATNIEGIALSPDSRTLFYSNGGVVWSLGLAAGAKPKRVIEGNQLCIDPSGRFLYVVQAAQNPAALLRVSLADGATAAIPLPADVRMTTDQFSANAVDARGRLLMEVSSADSFFFSAAIYDPESKILTRIPVKFSGDIWTPSWGSDGAIAALGASFSSSIWRFHPGKE
jgi:Tol biopolymer transport system component